MSRRVMIVGGGLAGLAAAVALGERGLHVTLLESRPRWGGRASSFVDQTTGEAIDNCQHVSMGCCTNFNSFCEKVGIDPFFRRESQILFFGMDGKASPLSAVPLPAPWHLFPSLLRLGFLSARDKLQLAWGMRALARTPPDGCGEETFAQWLVRHHQGSRVIERFWHVVLVSALSETLDRIDVGHARKVFVDAFLANRHGWEVLLPTTPLHELYDTHVAQFLTRLGVVTRLQTGVKRIVVEEGQARGVELRNGEQLPADHVIMAVPHQVALALLPECWHAHPDLAGIARLESAPISSVHLWFDRAITDLPHATFMGRLSQWMFNREAIQGTSGDDHYYQIVISASRDVTGRPQNEVIAHVVAELAELWPAVNRATLKHGRLVTEHKAALSMTPGVDRLRPWQRSPVRNLQLAGDWTRTGWPSTMEGAVRSGYLAAENVLSDLGTPAKVLQPDLPVALQSRLIFGLR